MANREIKTKVAIDGEKEYKESLKNINSALGTLKSELKLVESQYAGQANSYAALSAKGDVLSRMYDQQKEKVKAAAEQLEKAKKLNRNTPKKYPPRNPRFRVARPLSPRSATRQATRPRSKQSSRRNSKRQRASSPPLKRIRVYDSLRQFLSNTGK